MTKNLFNTLQETKANQVEGLQYESNGQVDFENMTFSIENHTLTLVKPSAEVYTTASGKQSLRYVAINDEKKALATLFVKAHTMKDGTDGVHINIEFADSFTKTLASENPKAINGAFGVGSESVVLINYSRPQTQTATPNEPLTGTNL